MQVEAKEILFLAMFTLNLINISMQKMLISAKILSAGELLVVTLAQSAIEKKSLNIFFSKKYVLVFVLIFK